MQNKIFIQILYLVAFLIVPNFVKAADKMLQSSDLTYLGAFRVPSGTFGGSGDAYTFDYGGRGLAYNPINNSLYVTSHAKNGGYIGEMNIPAIVNSSNINSLNTATMRQDFVDGWAGTFGDIGAGGTYVSGGGEGSRVGGILYNGNKLVISQYVYYDVDFLGALSHASMNSNWTANGVGFSGMKTVGAANAETVGQIAGYMTWIPSSWRTAMGGPALTGLANVSIITRSSYGPSAWVFDPEQIGVTNPISATQVVGYPDSHFTLGVFSGSNQYISSSDQIGGVVWPEGSSTIMFFGKHGTTYCYGGVPPCVDPTNGYSGTHGYPYLYYVWAYDANDLVAVKNGTLNPWDLTPVWVHDLTPDFNGIEAGDNNILGAAYDETNKKLYISAEKAEHPRTIIHVFNINVTTPNDTTAPSAPSGLSVL